MFGTILSPHSSSTNTGRVEQENPNKGKNGEGMQVEEGEWVGKSGGHRPDRHRITRPRGKGIEQGEVQCTYPQGPPFDVLSTKYLKKYDVCFLFCFFLSSPPARTGPATSNTRPNSGGIRRQQPPLINSLSLSLSLSLSNHVLPPLRDLRWCVCVCGGGGVCAGVCFCWCFGFCGCGFG